MLHDPLLTPEPSGCTSEPPESGGQAAWAQSGTHLLAHGVQVGDTAAEVQDVSPGQWQLHGVDVGLLSRGSRSLHA